MSEGDAYQDGYGDGYRAAEAEITRLRAENEKLLEQSWIVDAELLSLREDNEKLREALRPFAELWSIRLIAFGTEAPDDYTFRQSVSCGIVRAAAAALKETGDE